MFDPRDLASDPRTRPAAPPRRDLTKEREQRQRSGHRREYDPRSEHQNFQERMDRAVADIGVYRSIATRDLAAAHFEGHPLRGAAGRGPHGSLPDTCRSTRPVARKAAPSRCSRSPNAESSGPSGWRANKDSTQKQKAWSGLVKPE